MPWAESGPKALCPGEQTFLVASFHVEKSRPEPTGAGKWVPHFCFLSFLVFSFLPDSSVCVTHTGLVDLDHAEPLGPFHHIVGSVRFLSDLQK